MHTPAHLLSLSQLARRLDRSTPTLCHAVQDGRITPDFVSGKTLLFHESRVSEIRAAIRRA